MVDQQQQQQNNQVAQQQDVQQVQQVHQQNVQPTVQPVVKLVNQPVDNVPIVQAQVVQGADGGMALKVQQTKLPEFWGQKDKDSISENEFVKRVDKMMSANNWSDKVAFDNFGLALRQTYGWIHRSHSRRLLETANTEQSSGLLQGGICYRIR
jgi:hypothetical protein